MTVSSTFTSVCRCSSTLCSPTTRTRPLVQPYFAALDGDAELARRFRNVDRADGAEQLAFRAALCLDFYNLALELLRPLLRGRELAGGLRFELGAARFELRDVGSRRERRLALRDQIVPRKAGLHLHAIADGADVIDLFEQYHFHLRTLISRLRTDQRSQIEPIINDTDETERQHHEHVQRRHQQQHV
jgi:hypothetical protein